MFLARAARRNGLLTRAAVDILGALMFVFANLKDGRCFPSALSRWSLARLVCGLLSCGMTKISYAGYRFPPVIIQQAIWLYVRFSLSFRDVEDSLAERGILVSYETVRRWVKHFGPTIAADLRKRRPKPHRIWHLDEAYLKSDGRLVYLWRAVDSEGEVLDVLVQPKRNKAAALKLMRKLLKKYGFLPEAMVTDELRSYSAAARDLGIERRHHTGRWCNNTGRKIRINRPGDENARCKVSRAWGRRRDFSPFTRPSITPSPFNTISFQQALTEPSGPRPCRFGSKSSPQLDLAAKANEAASNFQQRDNAR